MYKKSLQTGQSLMEMMFAMAILTVGVVTIGYLIIDALLSLRYTTQSTQARFLASEGVEAIKSIHDGDFNLLTAGTYGLALSQGLWTLVAEPDEIGQFRRTITVTNLDESRKEIRSQVSWKTFGENERSVSFMTHLTDWRQVEGEAKNLAVSIDGVVLSASSTELSGISFQNIGEENIRITQMNVSWNTPAILERVTISGADVFTASTSIPVASGTDIDITDYTVNLYTGVHTINAIAFDGDVSSSNFIVLFTLQDGSKKSVYISP